MEPPIRGVHQQYAKIILRILFVVLLSFLLVPSPTPALANHELASEVFDSVIILDSSLILHSGDVYRLHVLVKRETDFVPVQIRMPDSGTTYRTMSLTEAPNEHCPFADRQSQMAGIPKALERGELMAYDSRGIFDEQFSSNRMKSVDLIVNVQGELFVIYGLKVSGGCFWAQE